MNNYNFPSYTYSYTWTQEYPQWNQQYKAISINDEQIESMLNSSDLKEANDVIARIKISSRY